MVMFLRLGGLWSVLIKRVETSSEEIKVESARHMTCFAWPPVPTCCSPRRMPQYACRVEALTPPAAPSTDSCSLHPPAAPSARPCSMPGDPCYNKTTRIGLIEIDFRTASSRGIIRNGIRSGGWCNVAIALCLTALQCLINQFWAIVRYVNKRK